MTDVTVSGTTPTEVTGPPSERVEVARGNDGRPIMLPRTIVLATAWAWRAAIIALVLYGIGFIVLGSTQAVTTPLLLAVLIAALLHPLYRLLCRLRLPRLLAAGLSVLLLLLVLLTAFYFVGQQIASGASEVGGEAQTGLDQVIRDGSALVGLSEERGEQLVQQARDGLSQAGGQLAAGALAAGGTALTIISGAVLALFATLFFLADGPRIWRFLVRLLPREGRRPMDIAGKQAWVAVGTYVRVLPVVAVVDALAIGVGALVLGIPFALPIAVLTFFAAFLPVVGAFVAGAIAVLVAVVSAGPIAALIMLAIVIVVQQVEGNVLQPLLLGKALQLHPLAVVLSTAMGILLAGIVGGILAVPVVAGLAAVAISLTKREDAEDEGAADASETPAGQTSAGDPDEAADATHGGTRGTGSSLR